MSLFKYRVYLSCLQRLQSFSNTSTSFLKKSCFINAMQENNLNFITKLCSSETLTNEDWNEIRTYMTQQHQNEKDNTILEITSCLKRRMQGKEFDFGMISRCINLYASLKSPLSESMKQEVSWIYDELRKYCPVLDPLTSRRCIKILSKTERWEECIELLDIIKITSSPGKSDYSDLVAVAFRHGNFDIGTKYIREMSPKTPFSSVYLEYLECCKREFQDPEALVKQLERIMEFWEKIFYMPEHSILKEYMKVFKELGWEVSDTSIKPNGMCTKCKMQLSEVSITQEEFETLSNALAEKFVVSNDIYKNTNPKELARYKKFVEATKPYDVVIDGLNVIYTGGKLRTTNYAYKKLADCVKYFVEQKKKVLLIGRSHMGRKEESNMEYIKKNAHIFLVDDVSCDDQFVLHATLSSGINAKFISNDLLGGQSALIKDMHLKDVLLRWKLSHQCTHEIKGKATLKIQEPISYKPYSQKHGNAWHIPYITKDPENSLQNLKTAPTHWVCMTKKIS